MGQERAWRAWASLLLREGDFFASSTGPGTQVPGALPIPWGGMTTDLYFVDFEMPNVDGVGRDAFHNTFAFQGLSGSQSLIGDLVDIKAILGALYNTAAVGATNPTSHYLGSQISRGTNACGISVYKVTSHLDGSPHGSPVAFDNFTMGAAAGSSMLPAECAVVVTLRGGAPAAFPVETPDADSPPDGKKDRPRQRHSGRIYLGPITTSACSLSSPGNENVLSTGARADICKNVAAAIRKSPESSRVLLSVWSRKNREMYGVTQVEVDDAFDTVRRRGMAPTARSLEFV